MMYLSSVLLCKTGAKSVLIQIKKVHNKSHEIFQDIYLQLATTFQSKGGWPMNEEANFKAFESTEYDMETNMFNF